MSKLSNYNGSVTLISGITQKNNGTFPLIEANAVLVDNDDKRLDALLDEIKTKHEQDRQALQDEINRATAAEEQNSTAIADINKKIPTTASADNQLADKAFVNSSINAVAATFRGNFATKAALDAWQIANPHVAKKNDYAIVQKDETHSNEQWRYLYQEAWEAQYKVNDAPFTEAQNAAINSGATKDLIDSISTKLTAADILNSTGSAENKAISQKAATDAINNVNTDLTTHINNKENPHEVTAAQVGLGNVNNTSDKDKPVSDAVKTELDKKLDKVTGETELDQAYIKNAAGEQTVVNISKTAAINTVVSRDNEGKIKIVAGVANDDAVNVKQLNDTVAAAEPYHINLTSYTGTVTQDQYDKLKADTNSYIIVNLGTRVEKFFRTQLYEDTLCFDCEVINRGKNELRINADLSYLVTAYVVQVESHMATAIEASTVDTYYPSVKAVKDYVSDIKTTIDGELAKKYSSTNPPPYPVTSVNGQTGAVVLDIPEAVVPTAVTNTITNNKLQTSIALSNGDSVTSTEVTIPISDVAKNNIIERVTALPTTIDENTADFILVEA